MCYPVVLAPSKVVVSFGQLRMSGRCSPVRDGMLKDMAISGSKRLSALCPLRMRWCPSLMWLPGPAAFLKGFGSVELAVPQGV